MRVLVTSFTYPPEKNGVAECARIQAEGLARAGHQVTVATRKLVESSQPRAADMIEVIEFDVHDTDTAGRCAGPDCARYRKYIADADHDAILCHAWQTWTTDLALDAFPDSKIGRKIMVSHGFSAHLWQRHPGFPWGLGQWLRNRAYAKSLPQKLRSFDHVVFLSEQVDRDRFYDHCALERFGGPDFSVIPNGARTDFPATGIDFRAQHDLADRFVVLCVSNYTKNKGQETVLRAFLEADLEGSALIFIGSEFNAYSERLKSALSNHAKARILFLDKQNQESISAAYRAADLFALASKSEAQPLVLLDAMGSGTPFVSTDVGAVSQLPGGLLFHSEADLTQLLRRLRKDEKTLEELAGRGSAATGTLYNWERYVKDYHRLLAPPTPPAPNNSGEYS